MGTAEDPGVAWETVEERPSKPKGSMGRHFKAGSSADPKRSPWIRTSSARTSRGQAMMASGASTST